MKRLSITTLSGEDRVSRSDGKRLRAQIEKVWDQEPALELDFENIRIASVSFLDEGIALLALDHPLEEVRKKLRVVNMKRLDQQLLEQLLETRAQERNQLS